MTDVASSETLLYLQKLVKASLEETKDFWSSMNDQSKLLPLLEITGLSRKKFVAHLIAELLSPQRNKNKRETNASAVSLPSISASLFFQMFSPLQVTPKEGLRLASFRHSWVINLMKLYLTWAPCTVLAYGKIYF
jgi:hypothetical protein